MTATVLQCDREALKPCPFCGSAGKIVAPLGSGNIRAGNCSADNCHASGPWGKDEAAAITAWNTRHDSTREIIEIREAIEFGLAMSGDEMLTIRRDLLERMLSCFTTLKERT